MVPQSPQDFANANAKGRMMGDLVHAGSKYSDEQRRTAAIEYCIHGTMSKVSALTRIPETTLANWKNKSDWWDVMVAEVRSQIGEAILAQNLQIATKAAERVLDSLENGDEKLIWDRDKREHVIKRVKPTGKDAAVICGISQDKARIQMNLPTSITTKATDAQALAQQFADLSRQWDEKQRRVVAVQDEDEAV